MNGGKKTAWRKYGRLIVLLAAACLPAACGQRTSEAAYAPTFVAPAARSTVVQYNFGVTPMSNFRNIYEVFQPIVEHLNGGLSDAQLVLEVPRGLDEHAQRLKSRKFAFALSNPYHTWNATRRDGYRVFAKLANDDAFRGIWIVRRDSGITALADLKGRTLAFPPKSALAGTMMTRMQLKEAGVDPESAITATYVASQHASIMAVHAKHAAAGATWPLAWAAFQRVNPAEAAQLEVRFPTGPLVNQGIVARDDVPPALVARVGELLAAMHHSEKGRALLAQVPIERFEAADGERYDVVGAFMDKYEQAFPAAPK